jgi:hypothetical protein
MDPEGSDGRQADLQGLAHPDHVNIVLLAALRALGTDASGPTVDMAAAAVGR